MQGLRTFADKASDAEPEEQSMWKRDQVTKPATAQPAAPAAPPPQVATPPIPEAAAPAASNETVRQSGRNETHMVNIGKSVVIKGDLQGSEDLTIEGQVEGKIELKDNVLTIGPNGRIKAQVFAKTVIVLGTINGNVTASEKVEIRDSATVEGNVLSPKVAIAEGAQFHGSVDMQRSAKRPQQPSNAPQAPGPKPAAATAAAGASMH
jgi:cytoskeletal protein CcmA (bactofilin family)